MTLYWPPKTPTEVLDYEIDWSVRLAGDTILTSTWAFTQTDGTLVISSQQFITNATKIFLSGGTLGQIYLIANTITTGLGDTMVETVSVVCSAK